MRAWTPGGRLIRATRSCTHTAQPWREEWAAWHPPRAEGEQTISGQSVCRAQLVNGSPLSSQEILCPFSTPYLGYQDPTGLFGGCNSFLGHSDTPLWRKPNKAWLFLFLTLTPGQRGAVTGCRALPGNTELPLLATCTASGTESCFLFGWLLCCCF